MIRTAFGWLVAIVVVVYFVKHGGQVGGWVHEGFQSLSNFVSQVSS
jgi:hypothetical protein